MKIVDSFSPKLITPSTAKKIRPYIWIGPVVLVLFGLLIYPWAWCFWLSFQSWSPLKQANPVFVGFANYISVFTDKIFFASIMNTLVLMVSSVGISFVLGFAIALLLTKIERHRSLVFVLLLIPMMLPQSMVGLMWKFFYHTEYGLFNWILRELGGTPVGWLADPKYALLSVIIIEVWINTPFVIMILFAGLQSISIDPYEAALIDGANSVKRFWHITLPMIKPLIIIVLLFRLMHAIRAFDTVYSLFRSGGPGRSAQVMGVYLYETYRVTWQLGLSSAISVILLLLTFTLTLGFSVSMVRKMN